MATLPWLLLQAAPPTTTAPSGDIELVGNLLQQMVIIVIVLLLVMVVAVTLLLLKSRSANLARSRQARRTKPTELEDLWFENPIERKGIKPEDAPRKEGDA